MQSASYLEIAQMISKLVEQEVERALDSRGVPNNDQELKDIIDDRVDERIEYAMKQSDQLKASVHDVLQVYMDGREFMVVAR